MGWTESIEGVRCWHHFQPYQQAPGRLAPPNERINKARSTPNRAPDGADRQNRETAVTDIPKGSVTMQGVLYSVRIFGAE